MYLVSWKIPDPDESWITVGLILLPLNYSGELLYYKDNALQVILQLLSLDHVIANLLYFLYSALFRCNGWFLSCRKTDKIQWYECSVYRHMRLTPMYYQTLSLWVCFKFSSWSYNYFPYMCAKEQKTKRWVAPHYEVCADVGCSQKHVWHVDTWTTLFCWKKETKEATILVAMQDSSGGCKAALVHDHFSFVGAG